jgi:hypothetical protein
MNFGYQRCEYRRICEPGCSISHRIRVEGNAISNVCPLKPACLREWRRSCDKLLQWYRHNSQGRLRKITVCLNTYIALSNKSFWGLHPNDIHLWSYTQLIFTAMTYPYYGFYVIFTRCSTAFLATIYTGKYLTIKSRAGISHRFQPATEILPNVNNNFQQMHFSYIYYIFQYSYMFRSVRAILRELHSKMMKC